jgi:hypothetical protein
VHGYVWSVFHFELVSLSIDHVIKNMCMM